MVVTHLTRHQLSDLENLEKIPIIPNMLRRIEQWMGQVKVTQPIDVDFTYPDGTRFQEEGTQTLTLHRPATSVEKQAAMGVALMLASTTAAILIKDPVAHNIALAMDLAAFGYAMNRIVKAAHDLRGFVDEQLPNYQPGRKVRSTLEIQMERDMRGRHASGCM